MPFFGDYQVLECDQCIGLKLKINEENGATWGPIGRKEILASVFTGESGMSAHTAHGKGCHMEMKPNHCIGKGVTRFLIYFVF